MSIANIGEKLNTFITDKRNSIWVISTVLVILLGLFYITIASYITINSVDNRLKNIEKGFNIENRSGSNPQKTKEIKRDDGKTEIY